MWSNEGQGSSSAKGEQFLLAKQDFFRDISIPSTLGWRYTKFVITYVTLCSDEVLSALYKSQIPKKNKDLDTM